MVNSKQKIRGGKFCVWLVSEDLPVNFALTTRIRGNFTPDQFQQAINKIQLKYPSSTTRVIKETDASAYQIPDPNLKYPIRIIRRQYVKQWVDEVSAELAKPFNGYTEPPVRFIWLRGDDVSEIILVCNHAFVDGFSAVYLARDLLNCLGYPEIEMETTPNSTAMSELVPSFHGKRFTLWRAKLKALFLKLYFALTSKADSQWKDMVETFKRPYSILPWELSKKQTAALVSHCRANGTTVHSALCTAFLRAFGEIHRDGWKRKIQSPIDLRNRLTKPINESFGLYIHLVEFYVDCSPERDFWEVAREIKQYFKLQSADKPVFSSILELMVLTDDLAGVITPKFVAEILAEVEYDLSISNLGRLEIPAQYGSLQMEAVYGPTLGTNPQEVVLGVSTVDDKMHFTMSFTDMTLTLLQAEQIKDSAMRWLAKATGW